MRIYFSPHEILTVISPSGLAPIDNDGMVIRTAEEVRWGCYSYGAKIKSTNWRELVYRVKKEHVEEMSMDYSKLLIR